MGWWGADILGGDTPLDAVGELEKAIGWNYEKRGFIYDGNNAEQANKALTGKTNWAKVQRLIRKMASDKRDMEDGSLLAVVYVLMQAHVKLTDEIAKITRDAIGLDEWGREGDQERLKVLDEFRIKVDAATSGKAPEKRTFVVRLEREVRYEGTFEVEAISEMEAERLAKQAAQTASVVPSDKRHSYPRPKNVMIESYRHWRIQHTSKLPVGGER